MQKMSMTYVFPGPTSSTTVLQSSVQHLVHGKDRNNQDRNDRKISKMNYLSTWDYHTDAVTETTADIVCIICKDGSSCRPNEIVLCDKCGIGYHQKCHEPYIADNALEPDAPWMCVYCTNGTECPYLLNPFEAKIKDFTSNSRKQGGLTKDNECPSDRKADFRNNNNNNNNNKSECPRPLMEDCYDDHHRRIELNTSTSANTARHILRDHHAISRRGMPGHRMSGDHGNRIYKFPKSYDGSRERLHYRQMESVAKRRRMVGQEKQTQDVWDNGYTPEKVDHRNKVPGKEGPREKQRLTQDLERQRKKLKEDMERGQVLEREHSQLLTSRPKKDTTSEGKSDTEESTKHENTLYFRGREWTAERNHHENTKNRKEINSNDKKLGKKRNSDLTENTSITRGVNELVKHEPRRQLDPCGCEGTEGQGSGSQEKRMEDNNLQEIVGEISEMQCEHSMNSRASHEGETTEFTYKDVSPPNVRDMTVVEMREELVQGSEGNINDIDERVFTSEKVEVIGRSDDIVSNHEENVRQSVKGKAKKGQGKNVSRKRFQKSFSEKTNYDNTSEVNDGLFHESRTQKTKESEHVGTVKTDLMHEGSSGLERQSISNSDNEIHDTEDGESKEKIKGKSHDITHEGESNAKKDKDEVQNVINQNRVRSDLPRHNWLIERLRNEKKLPPGAGGSTDSPKEKRVTTDEIVVDSELEVTPSKSPGDVGVPVLENTPNNGDVDMETNDRDEISSIKENDEEDDEEPGSPNFELLSPKSVKNSPENNLSPELKQYSPTRVPASPCEDDELQKPPSPLLKVPEFAGNSLGIRRKSVVREYGENNEIIREDKFVLHDGGEKRCTTLYQRHSVHAEEDNFEIIVDEKEQDNIIKDGKIIEIKSDGEGNEDIKENNDTSPEREMLKITTGRSVNPVSPFLRSERRSMEEHKSGSYAPHHHAMLPRSPRFPADLPSHFMKPGYIPGYPPRTFTPHLITHNPAALAAVSPGHLGHLATRMNLAGHSKPDHNCPYHGKKATDKLPQHTPGYPTMHSDHHHLGGIPFHEGVPDFALHEKLRETHAQMASDPIGFHRRLPSLYDNHRQIVMPHGMPGHVFPPGYLPPRLLDEHMLLLDRDRFERRMFAMHEPQKHAHSGPSEEHRNAPKCVPSHLQEKHIVSAEHRKHIVTPSCDSEPAKSKLETTPGNYHSGHHQDMLHQASRQRSPHEMKYYKVDQASNIEPNTKTDKHPSFTTRHPPSFTPPTPPVNIDTSDHRPSLMQHGDTKTSHGKPGNERNTLGPNRSPASHEQEAIRRDFQGRLNMLEKKFIKGLEAAAVKPGDESMLSLHENIPIGQRKPGAEFGYRVAPITDEIARPLAGNNASLLPSKYNNHDNQRSPAARNSPPGLRVSDRDEQEKHDVSRSSVPSHKPTLPMTSYYPHGNTGAFPRGVPSIDEMKKSAGMMHVLPPHLARQGAEHAAYHDHMAWAMRSQRSLQSYPLTKINPEPHQKSPIEKNNKGKVEHMSSKQELEEKEISLAREKHFINLTHLENERRKALMVSNDRSRPRLPSRGDERLHEERARPGDKAKHDHLSPKAREEALHRDWEEIETRKRKYAEIRPEILAMHGRISPFGKTPSEQNKRLKGAPTDGRIASHNPLHMHLHEDFNSRKDRYLSMYVNQHVDPYGHVTSVPYPGRGRNVGNAPFYMGRFDLQRCKTEQSVEVRKEREIVEKIVVEKQSNEKDTSTAESAKKRAKPQKMCDVCRKEASFLCSGCEKAWYCSAKCQFKAWIEHSKECSQTKRR